MRTVLFILILFASCQKEQQPQLTPALLNPFGSVTFTSKSSTIPLITIYNSQNTYDPTSADYTGRIYTKDSIEPGTYKAYFHTSLIGSETIECIVTAGNTTILTSNLF